jgi:hypothetical protein
MNLSFFVFFVAPTPGLAGGLVVPASVNALRMHFSAAASLGFFVAPTPGLAGGLVVPACARSVNASFSHFSAAASLVAISRKRLVVDDGLVDGV